MSDWRGDKRSREAWELAASQHGVVARRQLLELGFNSREIEHRVARGRLHPVMRGVYQVGWPDLTRERRWTAAVLACGDGAVLSHRSAAALWGIGTEVPGRIDISVRRASNVQRRGLRVHRRPKLPDAECVAVERGVNDADKRDLIDPETLRAMLDDWTGQIGVPALRRILDRRTFRLSDSDLEIYFRPIATAAGLGSPLTKQIVNGWEVDFYWPDLGLIVETDGLRYHRTPSAQSRDARRDRAHIAAGMTPLRFIHYEIRYEADVVRRGLERTRRMILERMAD